MLLINERSIEAVAALLYNTIYDLDHPTEGAWCIQERRDDPAYLAFAESLLLVLRDHPNDDDHTIIQAAIALTNQNPRKGFGL